MGVTESIRLPAGWYPDPDGDNQRRWWDGREWTQYTAAFQRPTPIDEGEPENAAAPRRQAAGNRLGRWLAGVTRVVPRRTRNTRRNTHRLER